MGSCQRSDKLAKGKLQVKPLFNDGCYWGQVGRAHKVSQPRAFALKKRFVFLFAIPVLLLPALAAEAPLRAQTGGVSLHGGLLGDIPNGGAGRPEMSLNDIATPPLRVLQNARRAETLSQVRIRQRVIIRISPSTPDTRERMMASLPRSPARESFEEVPHDDCVEVDEIVGVQPTQDNRLLLFMNNRQVLAASLDRACTARAFYSGFYVERNEDGRLCIGRDQLQSRAGVSCEVSGLSRIVAAAN